VLPQAATPRLSRAAHAASAVRRASILAKAPWALGWVGERGLTGSLRWRPTCVKRCCSRVSAAPSGVRTWDSR
jgi:hypothetical protein